mmetsp:Transcript_5115/g.15169  ORF Transcript_5115/g.15169 Transcript_5115/m.15169 type:complete len:131 (-) Transcript_5115:8-400(-)
MSSSTDTAPASRYHPKKVVVGDPEVVQQRLSEEDKFIARGGAEVRRGGPSPAPTPMSAGPRLRRHLGRDDERAGRAGGRQGHQGQEGRGQGDRAGGLPAGEHGQHDRRRRAPGAGRELTRFSGRLTFLDH